MVTKVSKAVVTALERMETRDFIYGPHKIKVSAVSVDDSYRHYNSYEYIVNEGEEPKIGQHIKVTIEQDAYGI